MSMDVGSSSGGIRSEINITPFVDVVLVLLIIFMVLTPLVLKEIGVVIPRKADREVTADVAAQQMVLQIKSDTRLLLGGQPITLAELPGLLRRIYAAREDKLLFVRVEDGVNYGLAVKAMDLCRGAGITSLGMTTKK